MSYGVLFFLVVCVLFLSCAEFLCSDVNTVHYCDKCLLSNEGNLNAGAATYYGSLRFLMKLCTTKRIDA